MLEEIFPVLDIYLAALSAALLLAFRTEREARESTELMKGRYGRLRVGLILFFIGLLIATLNSVVSPERTDAQRDLVRVVTYPFYYLGVLLISSATWSGIHRRQREGAA